MSKIAILLIALVLMVFGCQLSAQSDQGGRPAQEESTGLVTKPPVDTCYGLTDYDEPPVPIKQVNAKYPEAAIRAKLEGEVRLRLLVSRLGTVDTVIVIQPTLATAELERAAVEAAKQWVFKPATREGKPIAFWVSFPTKFMLQAKSKK